LDPKYDEDYFLSSPEFVGLKFKNEIGDYERYDVVIF